MSNEIKNTECKLLSDEQIKKDFCFGESGMGEPLRDTRTGWYF